jgi:hypothetical protein
VEWFIGQFVVVLIIKLKLGVLFNYDFVLGVYIGNIQTKLAMEYKRATMVELARS